MVKFTLCRSSAGYAEPAEVERPHRLWRVMTVKRTLALVVVCLFGVAIAPALAWGSFGELTRFGQGASGSAIKLGQIDDEELRYPEEFTEVLRSHLLGVEPVSNDVYVLDEPENFKQQKRKKVPECEPEEPEFFPEECIEETGPITRRFRIQEFAPNGSGGYDAIASASFEEKCDEGPGGRDELGVEGIAVDPVLKRLYILTVDVRDEDVKIDRRGRNENLPVASELVAFSTQPNSKGQLEPAGKPKGKSFEEVLTGSGEAPGELGAQSETPGRALLEPAGITVDPATHEIIVFAHEDSKGEVIDSIKNPGDHYVLQRILPDGEVVSGAKGRYVDTTSFFKESPFHPPPMPNSPVVVGPEDAEQIYVSYSGGIVRMPYNFQTESSKLPVYAYLPSEAQATSVADGEINEEVAHGPVPAPLGGALSVSPGGLEGSTIYAPGQVHNQQPEVGGELASVLAFSPSGTLLGWAGAQSIAAPRVGEEKDACVLEPTGAGFFTPVAAGSDGKVFVLATEFLENALRERNGEETIPFEDAVVELGPGGEGCTQASGGGLAAEVNGEVVSSVKIGEPVSFSSFILQGDSLKAEWDFGDGTSETVTNDLHCTGVAPVEFRRDGTQCPGTSHTFTEPGVHEVIETVYTDNLDTPTITQKTTVTVSGSQAPTAIATGPLEVARHTKALFDGSASFDPAGPNEITKYHWSFGDGQEATTSSPTIEHEYASVGAYTVSLTVTDAHEATSAPDTLPSPVVVFEPQAPAEQVQLGQQSGAPAAQPSASVAGFTTGQVPPSPTPEVSLTGASLSESAKGLLPVTLYCASGQASCSGTLTLRALVAHASSHGRKDKPTEVTLASGTFAIAGASRKRVELRLSSRARAILLGARSHMLEADLTIFARSPAGATRTSRVPVLVHAAVAAKSRKR
jgi:PKD repeat protein